MKDTAPGWCQRPSAGAGAVLTGGNFWQGAVTGLVVSALNHTVHKIQENRVENNYKKYLAIVAGESSDDMVEAMGIGEAILRRMEYKDTSFEDNDFINKIGGAGQFDAIDGKIYNDVMKMNTSEIFDISKNKYWVRTTGANFAYTLKTNFSQGAYFWNATSQKNWKNVGFNWRAYNNGTFEISAEFGETTFFKYTNKNKTWP